MSKFFKPVSSGKATLILSAATVLSYGLGLVRDLMLSYYFGASSEMDAYNTAFLIPDLIFNFTIAAALASVFLPTFRDAYLKNREDGEKLAGSFLVVSQIVVVMVAALSYVFMPFLVKIIFGHAELLQQEKIILYSRIMLVSPILFGISNTLGVIAMSFKHYLSYALSPGIYNIGIIFGIYFWGNEHGVLGAIYGVVIGLFLHLGIRFFDLRKIQDFKIQFELFHKNVGEIFLTSFPRSFGLMVWQFNAWIYNVVGYSLAVGSISAFNYAKNLQSFAVSLFGISVATAVFPYIVDFKSRSEHENLVKKIEHTFLQILLFTVPSAIGLYVLDLQAVDFLFGRGEFASQGASVATASILMFLALAIPFESLSHLISRIYYAHKNTWIPVLINFGFLGINLIGCLLFADRFGASIFGISFLIGSVFQISLLCFFVRKYVSLNWKKLGLESLKIVLASCVMGLAVNYLQFLPFLINVLCGVFIYAVLLWKSTLKYFVKK